MDDGLLEGRRAQEGRPRGLGQATGDGGQASVLVLAVLALAFAAALGLARLGRLARDRADARTAADAAALAAAADGPAAADAVAVAGGGQVEAVTVRPDGAVEVTVRVRGARARAVAGRR